MKRLLLLLISLSFVLIPFQLKSQQLACPTPDSTAPDEPQNAGKVIVNEISFNSGGAKNDYIELYATGEQVNMANWQLILKGSGGVDKAIILFPGETQRLFPWRLDTTAGRYMVFASSLGIKVIKAAIASGALVEGVNVFEYPEVDLHNTLQELLLMDNDGDLVYYLGYGNGDNAGFEYDCAEVYPELADTVLNTGNDTQICTAVDGESSGTVDGDLVAGCNDGDATLGTSNDPEVVSEEFPYQIQHNSTGFLDQAQAINIKACANIDCTILRSEALSSELTLSSDALPLLENIPFTFTDGRATVPLLISTAQTITLGLANNAPGTTLPVVCVDELNGNSCDIVFSPLPEGIDHYRLEHDGQGLTCEAESITLKACADIDCTALYDKASNFSLSNPGLSGNTTINIPVLAPVTVNISYTDTLPISFTAGLSTPTVPLRCFNGATETCEFVFNTSGFEFFAATVANKILPDQIAETNFNNVNLRAVKDDGNGACVALLDNGPQNINLSFDCVDPGSCKTPLNYNDSPLSELVPQTLSLNFSGGIASLGALNYPDAGRLQLSAAAIINGAIINAGSALVDVYPGSLALNVGPASLVYTGAGDTDTYSAGQGFTFSITAFGAIGANPLANYQPGALALKLDRLVPSAVAAIDGTFSYGAGQSLFTSLGASFTAVPLPALNFVDGEYVYNANYDEVGQISIDVRDNAYLGNGISSQGPLTLGEFIPAYFDVALEQQPVLHNTCLAAFSYVGEEISFAPGVEAILRVTAKNALDQTTDNYAGALWTFSPSLADVNNQLSYMDSSAYTGSATVIAQGQAPTISDIADYDGSGLVSVEGFRFRYDKEAVVSPFAASVDMVFSADFLKDKGVCFKENNEATICNTFTISNITGANLRYGRLALDNTYGPDTEALRVNIKAEYYDGSRWVLNAQDSCTDINFSEQGGALELTAEGDGDITTLVDPVQAAGKAAGTASGFLSFGQSNDNNDFLLTAPGAPGELRLSLIPTDSSVVWPGYLNFDWNGDGKIDDNDFPFATITFGQFRGNDKIIQWREVFN